MSANDGIFEITRAFDAPLDRVWKAWSAAEEIQRWWGPKGCTVKVALMEFRQGGFFHYEMRFPNGPAIWGRFLYRDIARLERIAWLNSFSNEGCGITRAPFDESIPLEILNEASFTESAGKTTVRLHARPHGAAEHEVKTFEGMFPSLGAGYGGTMDRLADALARA
jgi:uncharacterized protein YndB with AHSA1/START domain